MTPEPIISTRWNVAEIVPGSSPRTIVCMERAISLGSVRWRRSIPQGARSFAELRRGRPRVVPDVRVLSDDAQDAVTGPPNQYGRMWQPSGGGGEARDGGAGR